MVVREAEGGGGGVGEIGPGFRLRPMSGESLGREVASAAERWAMCDDRVLAFTRSGCGSEVWDFNAVGCWESVRRWGESESFAPSN